MADTILVRTTHGGSGGRGARARRSISGGRSPGVHVGIRTDGAWRSWRLIASVWDEYLRRDGATTTLVETGGMVGQTGANDRKHIDELAERRRVRDRRPRHVRIVHDVHDQGLGRGGAAARSRSSRS